MKVLINFEPINLITACAQIRKEYKDKYDYENPPSGHLEVLIEEISKLGMPSLEGYAMMLKDYDVNFLAYHLPKEENIIINRKILEIIVFRLSEEVWKVYFSSWQKYYNYLSNNLGTKNLFILADKSVNSTSFLPVSIYTSDLRTKMLLNSVDDVLSECVSVTAEESDSDITETLSVFYLISTSSVLGINILKKIFLFCSEKYLIKTSDLELCNVANAFMKDDKIKFFINFVTKVSPTYYKNYLRLADIARTFFNKAAYRIEDLPTQVRVRFQMWFSLLDIDKIFGEDERGRFWKARAIENNAIRVEKKSAFDMVIMYFEKYVATEFIINGDGPIYIMSNDEFYGQMEAIINKSYSKPDLKSKLYRLYRNTANRIEHRRAWRETVYYMISKMG